MVFFRIDLSSKHGLGHYNRVKSLIKHLNLINYKIVVDKLSNNPYFLSEKKNIISLYGKKNFFLKTGRNFFFSQGGPYVNFQKTHCFCLRSLAFRGKQLRLLSNGAKTPEVR
mgnify:CR=1 FL=1